MGQPNYIHVVMMYVVEKGQSTVCVLMAMAFYRRHGKEEVSVTPNALSECPGSRV